MVAGSIERLVGQGGLPKVVLRHNCGATAEACLFGATLTSYKPRGTDDVLFVSRESIFDGKKAIRGGVPVVFPWFGAGRSGGPAHGFARINDWILSASHIDDEQVKAVFSLTDTEGTHALWPHPFQLKYTLALSPDSLATSLEIENTGEAPFEVQALLHTYYSVQDINNVRVQSFRGVAFFDKLVANAQLTVDDRELAILDKEVDRIYHSGSSRVTLIEEDRDKVVVDFGASSIDGSGKEAPVPMDCVLWNPWVQKAAALSDFGDDEYRNMVCIEPGLVRDYVTVPPGQSLKLYQVLRPTLP